MILLYVLGVAALGLLGLVAFKQFQGTGGDTTLVQKNANLESEIRHLSEQMGTLKRTVEKEKSDKDELSGKNKLLFAQVTKLEAKLESLENENGKLEKEMTISRRERDQRETEKNQIIAQLENARRSLEAERARVTREDEERMHLEEEERDRIWAEHENSVIAQLTSLCKSPQFAFAHYTNTSLPEDFDGSLKPDFMIGFLDQYIIFDAKKSKQESLQTYINDAIKKTVQKVKKNPKIAPMIYLVVPTEALAELKTFIHSLEGYTIYVVAPESLPPILAALKRITTYEFADQMDPQERENIIQLIADFDFHINLRNAADILLTRLGTQVLEKAQALDPDMAQEVALRKQPMNNKASLAQTDLKKLVSNLTAQNVEIQQLVSPKSAVRKKELSAAEKMITETIL